MTVPAFLPNLPEIREEIAQYYSSVRRADDTVGRVLDALDRSGFRQDTLVMLKSDHGIAVPFAKTNVWRHSTRVPWIVRWPGVILPGTCDTEHVVAGIDVTPTFLEVAGVPPISGLDGRSILTILKGERQQDRDFVFTHINTIASKRDYTMRSVQGKRYGLIWNPWSDGETVFRNESMAGLTWNAMVAAAKTSPDIAARVRHFRHRVPFEFYDYEKDPHAIDNLIDDPDQQQRIAAFRARLIGFMATTNDPAADRFRAERTSSPVVPDIERGRSSNQIHR